VSIPGDEPPNYGIHCVGTPSFTNQWLTLPQCISPSDIQMQPRSEVGVDSAVKQTMLAARQGIPRSKEVPVGAPAGRVALA
jgi:hypothetical protein